MTGYLSVARNIVIKELKLKYKQSLLGFLWSMITPLVFLAIFNFVFSTAFMDIENYSLYVLTGLIFWQFFANATNQTIQSFIRNSNIIKTINIPIFLYPVSSILTEIVGLVISLVPFWVLMYFFGLEFSWHFVLLIPSIALFSMFSYGLSVFLGVLNVYLRDVSILWNTLNPALFYLTPIAYDDSIIPANYLIYLKLNPLYHFFRIFRDILYDNQVPDVRSCVIIISITIIVWGLGKFTFSRLEKGIISNI
ncbi:MAG: ABC transporter permease [Flavobacteriales bacterium]|nr:ABC transporter permease [Flavobacteriales bacterium]